MTNSTPVSLVAVPNRGAGVPVDAHLVGGPVARAIESVPIATSTDSGGLRFANTNWIYNLTTQGIAPGLYLVNLEMPDSVRYRTLISPR